MGTKLRPIQEVIAGGGDVSSPELQTVLRQVRLCEQLVASQEQRVAALEQSHQHADLANARRLLDILRGNLAERHQRLESLRCERGATT